MNPKHDTARRVKIVSNGSAYGTQVFVDGEPLRCRGVTFAVNVEDWLCRVTIEMAVGEVELEFEADMKRKVNQPGIPDSPAAPSGKEGG